MRVERPVWRRFIPRFEGNAGHWVRAGGHAAVQRDERTIDMFVGADAKGKITEAGLWAILSLEQSRYVRVKEGPLEGTFRARTGKHALESVLDWCDRDSMHEGPTRTLELDCLQCGACCHEANVLLDDRDFRVFRDAGRPELSRRPHVTRGKDGKVRLKFLPNGRCPNLQADNCCSIYAIRPFNCSVFPVGSEACLAARESTLNVRDDARV